MVSWYRNSPKWVSFKWVFFDQMDALCVCVCVLHNISLTFALSDASVQELIQAAIAVRTNAYCPYSNFAVGAALRLPNNDIITGCNVENAAHSPAICAERNAISHAISLGHREFTAVAVVAFEEAAFTTPCGVCRQTLMEFARTDIPVYVAKPAPNRVLVTSVHQLLPHGFVGETLRRSTLS